MPAPERRHCATVTFAAPVAKDANAIAMFLRNLVGRFGAGRSARNVELERSRVNSRAPALPAAGFADPRFRAGTRRIVVTVNEATFERIKARARGADVSFAEATRRLIKRGLREGGE